VFFRLAERDFGVKRPAAERVSGEG